MAGILPDKARELYEISDEFEPFTMFAIGYRGNPQSLPDKLAEQEMSSRSRKKLDDILFDGEWSEE